MSASTHVRAPETAPHASSVHRAPGQVPPERDLRHNRGVARRAGDGHRSAEGDQAPWLALAAVALGAGALATWYGTRTDRSERWSETNESAGVPIDETDELIASNKVEGTAVYECNGAKVGTIHNFMVGKRSGRVAYAVLSFSGFLGFGTGYRPLPWDTLTYDDELGGYVVDIDKERLKDAPSHQDEAAFSDPSYGRRVSEYWLIM